MKQLIAIIALTFCFLLPGTTQAEQTEFRDKNNNLVGTSKRTGTGYEYRDRHNNLVGTSQRRGNSTEYRDKHNNLVGTKRKR